MKLHIPESIAFLAAVVPSSKKQEYLDRLLVSRKIKEKKDTDIRVLLFYLNVYNDR